MPIFSEGLPLDVMLPENTVAPKLLEAAVEVMPVLNVCKPVKL